MKYLLAGFFLLMYAGDRLGLAISLAPGLSIKNLLLYLVIAGLAINTAVTRNRKVELTGVLVVFSLLIGYALVTWAALTFVVKDPDYLAKGAFIAWKSNLVDHFLIFLIFFYSLRQLNEAMWLLRAILWIAMLGNVITVLDTMNMPDLGLLPVPRKGGRFEGFIGQPNDYGLFLALYLPFCVALFREQRGRLRLLAGIGIFASALALILTGSRGAWVGTLGGAMLAAFYLRQYVSAQTVVRTGVALVVAGVAVLATAFVTGYEDLFVHRFSGIEGNPHVATSGRSSIWSEAIDSMMENPLSFLSGYGFYSYESSREFRLATHNAYLYFLYNLGVVGLMLFIGVFRGILSTARSTIALASGAQQLHLIALVFGIFSFLVAIIFNDYQNPGYLLWAYAGTAMRVAMCIRESAAVPAEDAPAEPVPAPGVHTGGRGYSPALVPHRSGWGRK